MDGITGQWHFNLLFPCLHCIIVVGVPPVGAQFNSVSSSHEMTDTNLTLTLFTHLKKCGWHFCIVVIFPCARYVWCRQIALPPSHSLPPLLTSTICSTLVLKNVFQPPSENESQKWSENICSSSSSSSPNDLLFVQSVAYPLFQEFSDVDDDDEWVKGKNYGEFCGMKC